LAKMPPSSTSRRPKQGRGGRRRRRRIPAVQGAAAARREGKRESGVRGIDSPSHLRRGRSEDGRPRWRAEVGGDGRGGGAARPGRRRT
jgi:hypothetical protein